MGRSAATIQHPQARLHWGVMTHMLSVAAFQLGDPVLFGILVETDDASMHGGNQAPGRRAAQATRHAQETAV